jgi:hypothetical protein
MRAALLPTPGDPFLLSYWLRNLATWRDYVDEVIVCVNGQSNPDVVAYDRRIIEEAGGRMIYSEQTLGHDGAMLRLLEETRADVVVLCEDDAYVRHPSEVLLAFDKIEVGYADIVGSPRHEDYAGQAMEWGPYVAGDLAELRHGLWPAFLFARRSDLLNTDQKFGDRGFPRGGAIPGWGPVTAEACDFIGIAAEFVHLDTFFATTFQLRAKGLRVDLQHHVRLYDAKATEDWLAEDPPWFHVTNLSTISYVVPNAHTPGSHIYPVEEIPDCGPGGGLWTRRVAWWQRTWLRADDEAREALPGYLDHLERFIEATGMSEDDLAGWAERFEPWVTWNDWAKVPA